MSLQFILGNSGSGKSHYLYQQIVNESMEHPEKNYLVLVPEQFTMQTQRDLCAAHPRGGIMNIDALSFMRLAYRVFEEVGREEQPVLDDEGKNLVIRRIAGKLEDDLKVLKGNLKKQGYNKTSAQLLLRWNVQQGIIPIPKSKNKERLLQNISISDFEITEEDMKRMNAMNQTGD